MTFIYQIQNSKPMEKIFFFLFSRNSINDNLHTINYSIGLDNLNQITTKFCHLYSIEYVGQFWS